MVASKLKNDIPLGVAETQLKIAAIAYYRTMYKGLVISESAYQESRSNLLQCAKNYAEAEAKCAKP